jgi:Zn-dependent alcohol dehydrogenase
MINELCLSLIESWAILVDHQKISHIVSTLISACLTIEFCELYTIQILKADEFVTHEMPFENINEAFKLLLEGKSLRSVMSMSV